MHERVKRELRVENWVSQQNRVVPLFTIPPTPNFTLLDKVPGCLSVYFVLLPFVVRDSRGKYLFSSSPQKSLKEGKGQGEREREC